MLPCRIMVVVGIFILLALTPTPAVAQTTFLVDPGGVGCPGATAGPTLTTTTVQAAVTAALGDPASTVVVEICPGVYTEIVTVMEATTPPVKDLTIRGLGDTGGNPDKTQVTISGGGTPGPIIKVVSASSVNISNLTVDGLSTMVPAPGLPIVGIQYWLVDGTISNVAVQNIRNTDGTAQGIGILGVGQNLSTFDPMNPPTERTPQIEDCMVMNTTRVGIMADGQGIQVKVHQCMLTGPVLPAAVPPTVRAANGFQVSRDTLPLPKGSTKRNSRPTRGSPACDSHGVGGGGVKYGAGLRHRGVSDRYG